MSLHTTPTPLSDEIMRLRAELERVNEALRTWQESALAEEARCKALEFDLDAAKQREAKLLSAIRALVANNGGPTSSEAAEFYGRDDDLVLVQRTDFDALEAALAADAGKDKRDDPLRCEVANGALSVTIGVDTLAFADKERIYNEIGFKVTDTTGFAKDVALELRREREDGSTILTDLFDLAMEQARNNGSTSIQYAADAGKEQP